MSFSAEELMEITKKTIADLIESDPLLHDLPKDVTLDEVSSQLALQHGKSMTVYLKKDNGEILPIVVPLAATVADLKRAVRRATTLSLRRSGHCPRLSWRYVWSNNFLVSGSVKLENDNMQLSELGVKNKCTVNFVKRLRHKNCINYKQPK